MKSKKVTEARSSAAPQLEEAFWDTALRLRRSAITEGFAMPGFAGRYYVWPEEYGLLSKYVELTEGDYLPVFTTVGESR